MDTAGHPSSSTATFTSYHQYSTEANKTDNIATTNIGAVSSNSRVDDG
jgi:hypothetical protein